MKSNQNDTPKNVGPDLDPESLHFIPLGGSEEFGINFNLYTYRNKWLAVDCGIGFADHRHPGIDVLLPDPTFIANRRKDLAGLIVTHAHEDHVGGVPYLWPRLQCPIYCTEFTAQVLRRKFEEAPGCQGAKIQIVKPGDIVQIGPFKVGFIHVAHSIPHAIALVLETDAGRVLHSGDWNIDPRPVLGPPTDEEAFKAAGNKGIDVYIGDSTNAEVPGRAGSESDVEKGLAEVFQTCQARVAVTVFASNIGRIRSIAKAAQACGRRVAVVGRSLHNMVGAAYDCGYLRDLPEFVPVEDMDKLPGVRQVLIVTGSQGEERAALARIARGEHRDVTLAPGDTVIFSSRAIPGNETEINAVRNNLAAAGISVVTPGDTDHVIHISGHPCRDEITDMFRWVRPQLVIPVHGERTMLEAQARLARDCQVPHVIVPNNGSVIRLGPGKPSTVDHIAPGVLAVEPNRRIVSSEHPAIAGRRKLQFSGVVHVTVVLDDRGDLVADPKVTTTGLINPEDNAEMKVEHDLLDEIEDIVADMERGDRQDDHAVQEEIRIGVRRMLQMVLGIKPVTSVHVIRI